MANANAQTHDIDLASPNLNLDKYKLGVSQFEGFNYRNSPFISHEIKNLYRKQIDGGSNCFVNPEDYNDIYKIDNDNKFYRKNPNVFGDDNYHLIKTFNCTMDNMSEYIDEYLLHISEYFKVTYNRESKKIIIYNYFFNRTEEINYDGYVDDSYFYEIRPAGQELHNQTIAMAFVSADKTSVFVKAVSFTDKTLANFDRIWDWVSYTASIKNENEFATITSVDFVNYFQDNYNGYIGIFINCCYTITEEIYQETTETRTSQANTIITKSREFISSNQSRQSAGALAIRLSYTVNTVDENDYGIPRSDLIKTINNRSIAEYLFLGSVDNIFYSALLRKDTDPIVGFPIDGTITNNNISSTYKYGDISNTKQWENTEIRKSTNIMCDGRFKTVTYGTWNGTYNKDVPVYVLWVGHQHNIQSGVSQNTPPPQIVNTMANTLAESPFPTLSFYERIGNIYGGDFWIVYYNREIANIVFAKETYKNIIYDNMTTYMKVVPCATTALFPWFSIDKIIGTQRQYSNNSYSDICNIYTKDTKGKIYKTTIHSNNPTPKPQLKMSPFLNRYLLFNSLDYYNCYDIQNNVLMHYADGLISIPITFVPHYHNSANYQFAVGAVAASYSTPYQADGNVFPGIQADAQIQVYEFQKIIFELADASVYDDELINNDSVSYGYYFYLDATGVESKVGLFTSAIATSKKGQIKVFDLGRGAKYPIEENNMLYSIPLFPVFDESNIAIICNINGFVKMSQVTLPRQGGKIFAIYYLMQEQEDFDYLFAIQNQLFTISENYIYRASVSNNIFNWGEVVCSCENLIYLCSTPLSAFFWSPKNKTIYQFQGDNLFHRGQCIDEIDSIIDVSYNPATNDVVMITDQYVIVLSEQYAFKINHISNSNLFNKIKFCNKCFALFNNTDCYLYSYNKYTGFSKQNIIVKTQLYGLGDNMLSETDCVFIRVFNAENEQTAQTVKVKGFTLTDNQTPLLERTFTITSSDWTDDGSYYIRYQPTYQKALGIQIEIESSVPITYIGVSNIPDTKMITKI